MLDDRKRSRYRLGLLFAWIPTLPVLVTLFLAYRTMAQTKMTGLGAVAGGLSQALVYSGLILVVAAGLTGIVLLARSFSRGHLARSFFAVLSILVNLALLLLFAAGLWLFRP